MMGLAKRAAALFAGAGWLLGAAELTPEQTKRNVDSFEYVWKTVRDKHWDPTLGGLNWQAVHDDLLPREQKAQSMVEAREAMAEMLGRLHLTHYQIIPADVYSSVEPGERNQLNSDGIDLRVVGNQALVTSVEPESPAGREGVSPGWAILKIGNVDVGSLIEKAGKGYAQSSLRELVLSRMLESRLAAADDVEFLDGHDQRVKKQIAQGSPRGTLSRFGFLPATYVWFQSKRVDGDTGYVRFNMFLDPAHVMEQFSQSVQGCMTCRGFIIDLRGNPGGIGTMATGMAGWFVDKPDQFLGTLIMRDTKLKFIVNPRPKTFDGPVAVLVDGSSASTSEILAKGLQDLHRARVFGSKTAAAALPSVVERLPDGDAFQYAMANYISEGGKALEGVGVTPDVSTTLTRTALLAGKDPALDAAVAWIREASKEKHEKIR